MCVYIYIYIYIYIHPVICCIYIYSTIYSGIVLKYNKERNFAIYSNIYRLGGHYAK